MVKAKKETEIGDVLVHAPEEAILPVVLLGRSPLIINRLAEKARQELLYPAGPKNAAERQSRLKHNPIEEFRSSVHQIADPTAATLLAMPGSAIKRALASAALDIPGAKKAQVGRLTYVPEQLVNVFGIPRLLMSVVRNSDMNHTPDVRSRAIVERWVIVATICFVTPLLKPQTVLNLLAAAGLYIGLGDWRPEKGAGNFGQFEVLPFAQREHDSRVLDIMQQNRAVQEAAMLNAEPFDNESRELLNWFDTTVKLRGKHAAKAVEVLAE